MQFITGETINGALCVFPGVIVLEEDYTQFTQFLKEASKNAELEVQSLGNFITKDSKSILDDGNQRSDFFFAMDGDLSGILIPRLSIGFKWFEDFAHNYPETMYVIEGHGDVGIFEMAPEYLNEIE